MRRLVEKYMPYCNYQFSNIGSARFIIRHGEEIRLLATERSRKTITHFDILVQKAENILSPKLF